MFDVCMGVLCNLSVCNLFGDLCCCLFWPGDFFFFFCHSPACDYGIFHFIYSLYSFIISFISLSVFVFVFVSLFSIPLSLSAGGARLLSVSSQLLYFTRLTLPLLTRLFRQPQWYLSAQRARALVSIS